MAKHGQGPQDTGVHHECDIIGDIHGHAETLVKLLKTMGYSDEGGVFRHPTRRAVFVGDFIDRGPHQRDVINLVRAMVEEAGAIAVMGNHEFNALAFATPDPENPDQYLRRHKPSNLKQHAAFLDAYRDDPAGMNAALDWFRTLPLFTELDSGARIVHACWDPASQAQIASQLGPNNTLTPELLVKSSRRGAPEYEAVETLLKGCEVALPYGVSFLDKDGHERRDIRVAWWQNPSTYDEAWFPPPKSPRPELQGLALESPLRVQYPTDAPNVFFGHYWLPAIGEPRPQSRNVFCLDYSVAKGGWLCAARTHGADVELVWV